MNQMPTFGDLKSGEMWIYFLEWTFSLMFPWYVSYSVSQDLYDYLSCFVLPSIVGDSLKLLHIPVIAWTSLKIFT